MVGKFGLFSATVRGQNLACIVRGMFMPGIRLLFDHKLHTLVQCRVYVLCSKILEIEMVFEAVFLSLSLVLHDD